jgi:hypothetical protein
MRKFSLVLSIALLAALALVAVAAQEPADKPQQQGKVISVDTVKNELAIKNDKGKDLTLRISPTTKILREGKEIQLSDVKAGDAVLVETEGAEGNMTAKSVTILPRKAG